MDKDTLANTYLDTRSEGFSEETKKRIIAGNQVLSVGYSDEIYKKALKVRKGIEAKFVKDFNEVDESEASSNNIRWIDRDCIK